MSSISVYYNLDANRNMNIISSGTKSVTLSYSGGSTDPSSSTTSITITFNPSDAFNDYIYNNSYYIATTKATSSNKGQILDISGSGIPNNLLSNKNTTYIDLIFSSFLASGAPRSVPNSVETIVSINTATTYYLVVATNNSNTVSNVDFEAIRIA